MAATAAGLGAEMAWPETLLSCPCMLATRAMT